MEGTTFYWISWLLWVFLTFFVNKQNSYRYILSSAILIDIVLANIHFTFMGFEIYAGGLFLILFSYSALYGEKRKTIIYFYICSIILSISYVTFHLFEIYDPVMFIFNKEWMMAIVLGYLAILLQKSLKERLLVIISGTMQGEFLYAYILSNHQFSYPIGSFSYLDACMLTISLVVSWSFVENASSIFERYFNLNQKGKQKSS